MEKPKYLDFLNPVHITWRKGTVDDPYVDRVDISVVVNQRLQLLEIPDKFNKVKISDMREVNYQFFTENRLKKNEFYVDYSNGMVFFESSHEGETLTVTYKGRGFISYPSSRIYHYDKDTDVVSNLESIIDDAKGYLDNIDIKQEELDSLKDELRALINDVHITNDNAKQIIEQALVAITMLENAHNTTKIIYRPFVETYDDIVETYPFPLVGWAVQVADTGVRYRWDGSSWVPIDLTGGNVPLANEDIDGLLSSQDFVKLRDIDPNTEERVMVFIIPQDVFAGIQDPHVIFPFDGTIENISASVAKSGSSNTTIRIEKSADYTDWSSITDTPIMIELKNNFDNGEYEIIDTEVNAGDIFRINAPVTGDIINLTVNVIIRI